MLREINFDGLIGPSHNYAGQSPGNLAATRNAGAISHPRRAALEGIEKMRATLRLGLHQGVLLPHDRPNEAWLARLGTTIAAANETLRANALSASPMWAANAATVSPGPDTVDGRCHLTVANLVTMPHRSHEYAGTLAQLRLAFGDAAHFAVHPPVPAPFGDEGAANHMRLTPAHHASGLEIFVYGAAGGPFPVRQDRRASEAIARLHALDPDKVLFAEQSPAAIAAGAFHNDVVAVANEHVLLAHEEAFARPVELYSQVLERLPDAVIIEVPSRLVSLADAIASYMFNAQLITRPHGGMALVVPAEAQENARAWAWLQSLTASNGPVREVVAINVRQSMANGGGPACLRLRVVADPARVDPRFMVDERRLDDIARVVTRHWPESIDPAELASPALWAACRDARRALLEELDLAELE